MKLSLPSFTTSFSTASPVPSDTTALILLTIVSDVSANTVLADPIPASASTATVIITVISIAIIDFIFSFPLFLNIINVSFFNNIYLTA